MKHGALATAACPLEVHADWYAISEALALLRLAQAAQIHYANVISNYGT
jgi:hypothetical protein